MIDWDVAIIQGIRKCADASAPTFTEPMIIFGCEADDVAGFERGGIIFEHIAESDACVEAEVDDLDLIGGSILEEGIFNAIIKVGAADEGDGGA